MQEINSFQVKSTRRFVRKSLRSLDSIEKYLRILGVKDGVIMKAEG
jgi:hypothetical protein